MSLYPRQMLLHTTYTVLSKAAKHVPYGESVVSTECITFYPRCRTNRGRYNRVQLYGINMFGFARIAQTVQRLATSWTVLGSNRGKGEIFHTHPDSSSGHPSVLESEYRVSILRAKRPGDGVDHPPSSSAEVKERVELYLCPPPLSNHDMFQGDHYHAVNVHILQLIQFLQLLVLSHSKEAPFWERLCLLVSYIPNKDTLCILCGGEPNVGLLNRLTPNDPYMGRTAPLTSKRCILYIYLFNKYRY